MAIDLFAIARSLEPQGFEPRRVGEAELCCVRRGLEPTLFEHVELLLATRRRSGAPIVMLNVGVSVVGHVRLSMRGLATRGGLDELGNVPDRGGEVEGLEEPPRLARWLESFATVAPRRAREHCAEKGPALLQATSEIRAAAARAFDEVLASAKSPEALLSNMTAKEEVAVSQILSWQAVQPEPALREVFRVAALGLLRIEDQSVRGLASDTPPPRSLAPQVLLPNQKIRVLMDAILLNRKMN